MAARTSIDSVILIFLSYGHDEHASSAKGNREGAREALDSQEKICREKGFGAELQKCLEQRKELGL
jgi:hypothetical protein